MFFKDPDPSPRGVPLGDLEAALSLTNLKPRRRGDSLIIQNDKLTTVVSVLKPPNEETENGPISAVVTVETKLNSEFGKVFSKPTLISAINTQASLGAVTQRGKDFLIESRLTVYEGDDAWGIQFPLLLFTIIASVDSVLGAVRRMLGNEPRKYGPSEWEAADFEQAKNHLSKVCVCTTGPTGFTAEFGLRRDAISAANGDHETALWQMKSDEPHPELGGGLFCILQMPHQIENDERLHKVIQELNKMEMTPHDLPPHFGAWCIGLRGNNPAYVSFLPNVLHQKKGIAVNVSIWALHRANWANSMLISMGVQP